MTENSEDLGNYPRDIHESATVNKLTKEEMLIFDLSVDSITSPELADILIKVGAVVKLVRGLVTLVVKNEEIPLTEHSILYYKNGVFKVLSIRRVIEVNN